MKLRKKFIAVPAIAITAGLGLSLTACGSGGSSLPVSSNQIVDRLTGATASDGTTATDVSVVGRPYIRSDGDEVAAVDISWSDGTQYRETYVYTPSTDDFTYTADYREN